MTGHYILLTTTPFAYPICFETTGIKVEATSQDRSGHARVNGVAVVERFDEIVYELFSQKS